MSLIGKTFSLLFFTTGGLQNCEEEDLHKSSGDDENGNSNVIVVMRMAMAMMKLIMARTRL